MVLTTWLWFCLFSPWRYMPPDDWLPIEANTTHYVFAYGSLQNSLLRRWVIGRHVPTVLATLNDHIKVGLNIEKQKGGVTKGLLFMVDNTELGRLDRFERLGVRYERVEMVLESGITAWVYRRLDNTPKFMPLCQRSCGLETT